MDILSSSGINNLINNYRYAERYKRINPLEERKSKFSNLSTTWNSLSGKLSSLKSLLSDFKDSTSNTIFGSKSVEQSNEDYFTTSASSSAALSSYNIRVNQLAKNDLAMSDTVTSSTSAGLSAGTYTFRVASGSFDQNIDVVLDGTENLKEMMELIADAINTASDGVVTASVFSPTTTESKLSVVAADSGETNAITIKDVTGTMLDTIGMDLSTRTLLSGTTGGYSYNLSELNSELSLNGVDIVRDSNTIDDLINDVTLSLKKEMEVGVPTINITIKNNMEAIKADIEDFIDKFNEAYKYTKDNYKSTEDGDRGVFVGNSSALSLLQKFSTITTNKVDGIASGDLSSLNEIGISFDPLTGLSISSNSDLEDAISNTPDQVAAIFNSTNGVANQLFDVVDNYVGVDGVIGNLVDSYDKSVSYYTDKIASSESSIDKGAQILRRQYEQLQIQLSAIYEAQSYFNMSGIF